MAHDIIVIGASAGGQSALVEIAQALPADLPATVFVVAHVSPNHRSALPHILGRAGPLGASHARDGAITERGHIYIAPPDFHLLLRPGMLELARTPRENSVRPAIDALFRSAAAAYGSRVLAVLLSGTMGDGTMGLCAIRDRGGIGILEAPEEETAGDALLPPPEIAEADYVLPVREIASRLIELARPEGRPEEGSDMRTVTEDAETIIQADLAAQAEGTRGGETATYSCPECGGVLWQMNAGKVIQFRCHVGHTYSPELLLLEKSDALESALWASVRMLVERATLSRQLACRLDAVGHAERAATVRAQADQDEKHVAVIRETLLGAARDAGARDDKVA